MPPRIERDSSTAPARRSLQDTLAWPIVVILLLGAAVVFFLPRFVPARFLSLAVGAAFALVTLALVVALSSVVERWLRKHASALALDAERQVQVLGVAGLPETPGNLPLTAVASAFADAGARAALRASERETHDLLAQLGEDAATTSQRALATVRSALEATATSPLDASLMAARLGLNTADASADALRRVTAAIPAAIGTVDLVHELRVVIDELTETLGPGRVAATIDVERAPVLIDRERIHTHLRELCLLARAASPPNGVVTVHLTRLFRAAVEDTPVRRTGDSRLTIVPRASTDTLRAWVQRAQPSAELVSIVVSDTGRPPSEDSLQRAFDAFAISRPGDDQGVTLPTVKRTIAAANGTIWLSTAREGGSAVHLLLPIASG